MSNLMRQGQGYTYFFKGREEELSFRDGVWVLSVIDGWKSEDDSNPKPILDTLEISENTAQAILDRYTIETVIVR